MIILWKEVYNGFLGSTWHSVSGMYAIPPTHYFACSNCLGWTVVVDWPCNCSSIDCRNPGNHLLLGTKYCSRCIYLVLGPGWWRNRKGNSWSQLISKKKKVRIQNTLSVIFFMQQFYVNFKMSLKSNRIQRYTGGKTEITGMKSTWIGDLMISRQ